MAESMKGLKRTHRCTELSNANIGEIVTVMGWVQKSRNKGGIIFVDMRDRSGLLQVIFEESDCGTENFEKAYPDAFKANVKIPPAGHFGDAELEIGRVCVQLASPDFKYMNGETLTLEGGMGLRP